jgi:hypothetical protein
LRVVPDDREQRHLAVGLHLALARLEVGHQVRELDVGPLRAGELLAQLAQRLRVAAARLALSYSGSTLLLEQREGLLDRALHARALVVQLVPLHIAAA